MNYSMYTYKSVMDFVNEKLIPNGYEIMTLRDGVLIDDFIAVAPDEKHYNFVFRAVVLNEWNSAYTMRKCAKISKALQEEIDAYLENIA